MNLDRLVEDIAFEIMETVAYGDASEDGLEHTVSVFVKILKLRNPSANVDIDKLAHGMLYAMMSAIIFDDGSKNAFVRAISAKMRELNVNANVNLDAIWHHLGIRH